jgi:hypothetical protein
VWHRCWALVAADSPCKECAEPRRKKTSVVVGKCMANSLGVLYSGRRRVISHCFVDGSFGLFGFPLREEEANPYPITTTRDYY